MIPPLRQRLVGFRASRSLPVSSAEALRLTRLTVGFAVFTALAFLVFMVGALPRYGVTERVLAWLLLVVAGLPVFFYLRRSEGGLPLLPVVCALYSVNFALPIFHETDLVNIWGPLEIGSEHVEAVLGMCIMSIVFLCIGYYGLERSRVLRVGPPPLRLHLRPRRAITIAFLVYIGWLGFEFYGLWGRDFPPAIRQFLIFGTPIAAAQAIVFILSEQGRLGWAGKPLVWFFTLSIVFVGIARGVIDQIVSPFLVLMALMWGSGRRVRTRYILVAAVLATFLQPVKGSYRSDVWYGDMQNATVVERVEHFLGLAWEAWTRRSDTGGRASDLSESIASRSSLLLSSALVVRDVPERVPFRGGESYRYLLFCLMPRALFPDKPSAQESNVWYAVEFGFLPYEGTATTMVGISHVAEAYANFGFFGIPLIFLIMGFAYRLVHHAFGTPGTGIGTLALYAEMLRTIPGPGTSLAGSLGGLIQTIVIYTLLSWLLNDRTLDPSTQLGTRPRQRAAGPRRQAASLPNTRVGSTKPPSVTAK